jgi:polyisoprenoid-binding protein YceI
VRDQQATPRRNGGIVRLAPGTVNREDWGLTWNMPLDGGGLVVSKETRIEIDLEAVLKS